MQHNFAKKLATGLIFANFLWLPFVALADDPLIIANLRVTAIGDRTATIEWSTNYPSNGQVEYGTSSGYGNRYGFQGETRTSHSMTIVNLTANTTYHFRVTAQSVGKETSSFDQVFKTSTAVDRDTPIVTDVAIPYQTATTATIQWRTNETADSQIVYGPTTSFGNQRVDGARVTVHDLTITGLKPLTTYRFQVRSKDTGNNIGISEIFTFRTTSAEYSLPTLELTAIRPVSANDPAITDTAAEISWRTTTLADGWVRWGTTDGLGLTVPAALPRNFFHNVKLVNLQPATIYYFQVESKDVFGKSVRSPVFTFTTRGGYSTQPYPSGQVLGISSGYDLMFYNSFDHGLDADFALGDKTAGIFGVPRITTNRQGRRGEALVATDGSKIAFSGENNFYVGQGTIAFWFKYSGSMSDNKDSKFFDLNPSFQSPHDLTLHVAKYGLLKPGYFPAGYGGFADMSNSLVFGLKDNDDINFHRYVPGAQVSTEQWQFAAVTWQYEGGTMYLYINGSRQGVKAKRQSFNQDGLELGPTPYTLGGEFYIGSASALIDEVAVFGRPLNDEEIRILYSQGVSRWLPKRQLTPSTELSTGQGQVLGASTLQYTQANALLKAEGQPDIYAIMNGQKHLISGPNSFAAYGYRWSDVRVVKPEVLEKIPDARLVRTPSDPAIYYLYLRAQREWLKLAIPSPTVFVSYPGNFWGNIITINEIDLSNYPNVQLIQAEGDSAIYLLENGTKHEITSDAAFDTLRLPRSHVATVNRVHLDFYPNGEPLPTTNATSIDSTDSPPTN